MLRPGRARWKCHSCCGIGAPYLDVAIYRLDERHGPSPTKDLGAQYAQGDVLLFLDAHCKPEAGAIAKLVADVDESHGQAIVTPTVCTLDPMTWVNDAKSPGHGYLVELDTLKWRWIPRSQMRPAGRFFESPV